MSPASNAILRDRAQMLKAVRTFFDKRGVLEVDCSLLSKTACIDAHIDLFEVGFESHPYGYLHSSPEYAMKRLLARGSGPIYQMGHVYRYGEEGAKHRPAFTMIEWYRPGWTFDAFLNEIAELLFLFIGPQKVERTNYEEVFKIHTKLDYRTASLNELLSRTDSLGIKPHTKERSELLNLLWGCLVEPHLGQGKLSVIIDFPPDQAALAKITKGVAERFEIYFNQMELANGYHELQDAMEQEKRLHIANAKRKELGKKPLPLDNFFLEALKKGLPDSYGVAVGFDRLLMLKHGASSIEKVLPL